MTGVGNFEDSAEGVGYNAAFVARVHAKRRRAAEEEARAALLTVVAPPRVVMRATPSLAADVPAVAERFAGLSLMQAGVLYVIGFHAEEDGVFRLPAKKLIHFVGHGSESRCAAIPRDLERFGLLERVDGPLPGWTLTRLGRAVFRELAGDGA
ncbi:MAG: hypothetical protein ABTQ31_10110 [Rhizobiaceae bacterium]